MKQILKLRFGILLLICLQLQIIPASSQMKSGFVKAMSGRLYYKEKGAGETVVLISGGAFAAMGQWDNTFNYLSKYYHVISYDPAGVGKSESPSASYTNTDDLKILCDSLKIRNAVFIGLSFSGAIVLEFSIKYPAYVKALVLAGPLVRGFAPSPEMKIRFDEFASATEKGPDTLLPTLYKDKYFIPSASANKKLWNRFQKLLKENYRSIDGSFEVLMTPPAAERLKEIQKPVLILTGEKDHPDLHRRAKFLESEIKSSKAKIIKNAGHLINLEAPDEFNKLAREFIQNSGQTSTSGYIKALSGKLYYEQKGTGETVIMVGRGAFMDSRQWDYTFEYLANYYHVIRYDAAGFGRSELPSSAYTNAGDLKVLFDSLKIKNAVLIGVSFGGGISMEFALQYPSYIKALVLSAPAVSGFETTPDLQKQFDKFAAGRAKGADSLVHTILSDENFIPAAKNDERLRERFSSIVKDNLRPMNPSLIQPFDFTIAERAKEIKAPVLFIFGGKDHPGLYLQTKQLHEIITTSKLQIIKNAGHVPHNETPEKFNQIVKAFIGKLKNKNCW
jgi:pimeloyl-ACP methyl ester carboxylesterase